MYWIVMCVLVMLLFVDGLIVVCFMSDYLIGGFGFEVVFGLLFVVGDMLMVCVMCGDCVFLFLVCVMCVMLIYVGVSFDELMFE